MKKKLLILLLSLYFVFVSTSCDIFGGTDFVNHFDDLPPYLTDTLYLNYSASDGVFHISDDDIDVVAGINSASNPNFAYALEFDTSTLNAAGYSLTTTYEDISDETTPIGNIDATLTLLCEKDGSPTLRFEFAIYYDFDIWVEKYVDDVLDNDYTACLTWDDGSAD